MSISATSSAVLSRAARLTARTAAVVLAAAALAAAGTIPALAAPSLSGTTAEPYYVVVGSVVYPAPSVANQGHGCSGGLYSARVAAGKPAYISGIGSNLEAGVSCTFSLERSANKGKSWSVLTKVTVPSVTGVTAVDDKTGYYYDGPGYEARVCFTHGSAKTEHCGAAIALAAGKGAPPAEKAVLVYSKGPEVIAPGAGLCGSALFGTTVAKKASSKADADVIGLSLKAPCTLYLEESGNGGATWTKVSPSYTLPVTKFSEVASYTMTYTDRPGELARSCLVRGKAGPVCTAPW